VSQLEGDANANAESAEADGLVARLGYARYGLGAARFMLDSTTHPSLLNKTASPADGATASDETASPADGATASDETASPADGATASDETANPADGASCREHKSVKENLTPKKHAGRPSSDEDQNRGGKTCRRTFGLGMAIPLPGSPLLLSPAHVGMRGRGSRGNNTPQEGPSSVKQGLG